MSDLNLSTILGKEVDYQEFTSSGTWVHPEPGALYQCYVEVIGGGGGGRGGSVRLTSSASDLTTGDGAGGGRGGDVHISSVFVTTDQTVVVGAGGAAGAGVSRNVNAYVNGSVGTAGGSSQFGPVYATGGPAGGSNNNSPGSVKTTKDFVDASATLNSLLTGSGALGTTATGTYSGSTQTAEGGGFGTAWQTPGGDGGAGAYSNNADAIAGHGTQAPSTSYGAGGGGGGSALVNPNGGVRTATSGNGAAGRDGIVRVWYWRAGE